MKRIYILVVVLIAMSMGIHAQVEINEENFPDANFRSFLLKQKYGKDGVITTAEIADIKSLNVSSKSIGSLRGIEYFTALESLFCQDNSLWKFDLSKNTLLKSLNCSENKIASLDLSANTRLLSLYCYSNELTSLNLAANTLLEKLRCEKNKLTTLDVSGNLALTLLYCGSNELTTLNLTKNHLLETLWCEQNQLTALDLSKNQNLKVLQCSKNALTELKLSHNTNLMELLCNDCQLATLNVSQNVNLATLKCERNQLTRLDISNCSVLETLSCANNLLPAIDTSFNGALKDLDCSSNPLKVLNVSNNKKITTLNCCFCQQLAVLDISNCVSLKELWILCCQIKGVGMDALIKSMPETDMVHSFYVISSDGWGKISKGEGNVCTKAQIMAAKAKGWIGYWTDSGWPFPEYAGSEPLDTDIPIDEEHFPDLSFRSWLLNQDYGKDGKLSEEEIGAVTSIDISGHQVEELKGLRYFTLLKELNCSHNRLKSLEVSENYVLEEINCSDNFIKETEMDVLIKSLPINVAKKSRRFIVHSAEASNEGNVCTESQVSAAKDNGWISYSAKGNGDCAEYMGDVPTSISMGSNGLKEITRSSNGIWYTVDGKKLTGLPSNKGIYIYSGRKCIVR